MKYNKYILLFICTFAHLLICTFAFAQQNKIDSLLSLLKKDKEDTNKVNHLNFISIEYRNIGSFDSSLYFCNTALANALFLNFKRGIATAYNGIGIVSHLQGDYPKALDNYLQALKLDEELKNKKGIATRLGNIGIVYMEQRNYQKALDYYFKALKMDEELENKNGVGRHLGNIGTIYYSQGNAARPDSITYRERMYTLALDYYFRALKITEELKNKNGMVKHLGNLGGVYYDLKDYSKSLNFYLKALKMDEELGDKNGIALDFGNIGSLYTATEKFAEAEKYLTEALKTNKEIGALSQEMDVEIFFTELYTKTNRYQLALEHYKKAMVLKDTLFSEEKNKEITRKEMNYEFEKKEAAQKAEQEKLQAVAEADKKKQQVILYSVIGGLLIVLVFAVFIFRALRITQKQKQLIEQQKKVVEEKQNEIIASIHYAKRIQDAILPKEKYIDKTLKRLMKNN